MVLRMGMTMALLGILISFVIGKDPVRVAVLIKNSQAGYQLVMYNSGTGKKETLRSDTETRPLLSRLVSNEPTGLICWNTFVLYGAEIHCYKQSGESHVLVKHVLPITTKKNKLVTDIGAIEQLAELSVHELQIDSHGENLYWAHPEEFDIWATSVTSGYSKMIVKTMTQGKSKMIFHFDFKNGYFFAAHAITSLLCWGRVRDTVSEEISVCKPNKQVDPFLLGIGSDPVRRRVYFCYFTQVHWVEYAKLHLPNTGSNLVNAEGERFISLLYFDNHIYVHYDNLFRLGYIGVVDVTSNERRNQLGLNIKFKDPWSIFEDDRGGEENPCSKLACSHLCLPTAQGYKCACPSGFTLVETKMCQPSLILTITTDIATNDSSSNYFCKLPENPTNLTDITSLSSCPPEEIPEDWTSIAALLSSHSDDSFIIPDPYGVGLLKLGVNNNCIEAYTFSSKTSFVAYCPLGKMLFFGMDFPRVPGSSAILFWVQTTDSSNLDHTILGRHFPFDEETYRIPLAVATSGFAVDSLQKRLYFVVPLQSASLISSKYDGSEKKVFLSDVPFASSPTLQFSQARLFWRQIKNDSTTTEIVAIDLDTKKTVPGVQHEIKMGSVIDTRKYIVFPVLEPNKSHACKLASCSHSCFPYSSDKYICKCPEPLKLVQDECIGFDILLLLGEKRSNFAFKVNRVILPHNETTTLFKEKKQPQDIMIHVRPGQQDICWMIRGQTFVKCVNYESQASEKAITLTVNPSTTMLVFDLSGQELFFNDGHPGNITLRSLRRNTQYRFKSFQTPNITSWTLDTEKRIFFWGAGGKLHFVALYTSQQGHKGLNVNPSQINAMTLDMSSKDLYFLQDQNLNRISYKEIFANSTRAVTWKTVYILPQASVQNLGYFKKSLYWNTNGETNPNSLFHLSLINFAETVLWTADAAEPKLFASFIAGHEPDPYPNNPCIESNCSHFCFPFPPLEDSLSTYECACSEGMKLNGKRDCEAERDNRSLVAWISAGVVVALLLIAGLVVALILRDRRNVELCKLIDEIQHGNAPAAEAAPNQAKKVQHLPLTCIIPPSDLFVNKSKLLGDGAYGVVFQGVYLDSIVAVKSLKPSANINLDQLSEFAKEVKIMDYIGYHSNIVRFYGTEISDIKKGSMYAVLEFSRFGSLLSILRKAANNRQPMSTLNEATQPPGTETDYELNPTLSTDTSSDIPEVSQHLMIKWSEHIASGMHYLSEKGIIHGDLATRNVLIFENNVAKISDFGLSRQLYNYANYTKQSKVPLPWRWMAIESLQAMEFSTKSDVWAYGVTLWEIFSLGHVPFPEHEWAPKFVELLRNGLILEKPAAASEFFYDHIMKPCWALNQEQRPNFLKILETFKPMRQERAMQSNDDYEFLSSTD